MASVSLLISNSYLDGTNLCLGTCCHLGCGDHLYHFTSKLDKEVIKLMCTIGGWSLILQEACLEDGFLGEGCEQYNSRLLHISIYVMIFHLTGVSVS